MAKQSAPNVSEKKCLMISSFQTIHGRMNSCTRTEIIMPDIQIALRTDRVMNILPPSCVSFTFSFKTVSTASSRSNNGEIQVKCGSLKYNGLFFASLCPNTSRLFYSQRTAVPSSRFPFWGRVRLNFATLDGSDQFVCKSAINI